MSHIQIRFTPHWCMGLIALIAILVLTRLGFWQLQRADEKKQMLAAHGIFAKQDPSLWQPHQPPPVQYQPIKVQGQSLPFLVFLDNQHYQHQFGYHVLSPLGLKNGKVILIDRGWVAGTDTRDKLPNVEPLTISKLVMGSVYYPSGKNWLLGSTMERTEKNRAVVELIDTKLISKLLNKKVYPFIIRLGDHQAGGLVRDWPIVAMTPQRHYAYALQWFAMAVVVLIIFVALNITIIKENR